MTKTVATIAAEGADRESIRDCLYRYCRGIDRIDAALLLSVYWPDATDDHGNFITKSAQEFVDHVLPILQAMDQTKHSLSNILIDIQGDIAYVESHVQAFHRMRKPDGTRQDLVGSGRYIDKMERRGGEWRIKDRTIVIDWLREYPATAMDGHGTMESLGYEKDMPVNVGQRKPDDISYRLLNPAQ